MLHNKLLSAFSYQSTTKYSTGAPNIPFVFYSAPNSRSNRLHVFR